MVFQSEYRCVSIVLLEETNFPYNWTFEHVGKALPDLIAISDTKDEFSLGTVYTVKIEEKKT